MKAKKLISTIKKFREQRGISLYAASSGKTSVLSRMENGYTSMSNQTLYRVMTNIGLEFSDLAMIDGDFALPFNNFAEIIWRFRYKLDDIDVSVFDLEKIKNGVPKSIRLVVDNVLDSISKSERLAFTEAQENEILQSLNRPAKWLLSDYLTLMLASTGLSNHGLIFVTRRFIVECQANSKNYGYDDVARKAVLEMALTWYMRNCKNELSKALTVAEEIESDLYALDDSLLFNFLSMATSCPDEATLIKRTELFFKAANALGEVSLERYLVNLLARNEGVLF